MSEHEQVMVSIVTVTYNSEKTVSDTLESVLAQTYDQIEYIVVDGASKDRTVEIVESYRPRFEARGYRLRVVSEPDKGMYDALNKGVAMATGDIIGQINSDDWYEPVAAQRVAETFLETGFDVFWGDMRVVKKSGDLIKRAKLSSFMTTRYWNHPTTFIRASVYQENPYGLHSMYDDFELILRLRAKGCKMVVRNEVLANFRFGGMSTNKDWDEMCKRVKWRCENYKRNGYGFIYYVDSALMEFVKYLAA